MPITKKMRLFRRVSGEWHHLTFTGVSLLAAVNLQQSVVREFPGYWMMFGYEGPIDLGQLHVMMHKV